MPKTKEEIAARQKIYYEENKEMISKKASAKRLLNIEENREKDKIKYENNKEAYKLANKKYYENNKEKVDSYKKQYAKEHPELYKESSQKWRDNNPMKAKISAWKQDGMIDSDWSSVYEMFIAQTNCWICGCDYSKRIKCLDHDHSIKDDDNLRYVCCNTCNVRIVG
mgnify:CR=1 FL=1